MTRKSFYRMLRKHAKDFTWAKRGECIRGYKEHMVFCPITAMAHVKNGNRLGIDAFLGGRELGLELDDMTYIATCADNSGDNTTLGRLALLRAISLED